MQYVKVESLHQLLPGDIVRNKGGAISFIVLANYGERVTAARVADITNPGEWEVLRYDNHKATTSGDESTTFRIPDLPNRE